ncbi:MULTISPECIES: hypothetical protein [Sulfolobaceae]|uniref:Uncharacterized protein n=2 Tax=Sulfurisphaera tokodaii TaxID=111955 RepID=Q971X2_SULTO|nr:MULTISPECIES: hypothetical protein [Sulfolobaceae]QIW24172.1 hypothetical protein EWF20_08465 [Sulfolobus sp. S-194]BAB66298.1 hypothetical protein STK_12575 [Sulfurisphaera tokodaii str. 7]HII73279.1 hypothetical protein [Sulfurisphaera tokodaii]
MKRAEVLIVEDLRGERKVDENRVSEIIEKINGVDEIIINKITLPTETGDDDLLGVHIIVREIAET